MDARSSELHELPGSLVSLPPGVDAPAVARQWVSDNARGLPPALLDDALLLVSELVSNAVRHGLPEIRLQLRMAPPGVGVAVTDQGDVVSPAAVLPDPHQPSGRGLAIVAALASAWGVIPNQPPPGKTVWFELHAEPSQADGSG